MMSNFTIWANATSPVDFRVTTSHFSGVVTNICVCVISVFVSCMSPVSSRTETPNVANLKKLQFIDNPYVYLNV